MISSKKRLKNKNQLPRNHPTHQPLTHGVLGIQKLDDLVISVISFLGILVFGYFRTLVLLLGTKGLAKFEKLVSDGRLAPARLTLLAGSLLFTIGIAAVDWKDRFNFTPEIARESLENILAGDTNIIGFEIIPLFIGTWLFVTLLSWCIARLKVKPAVAEQIATFFVINAQIVYFTEPLFLAVGYQIGLTVIAHYWGFEWIFRQPWMRLLPVIFLGVPLLVVVLRLFHRARRKLLVKVIVCVTAVFCVLLVSCALYDTYILIVKAATSEQVKKLDSLIPRRAFKYSEKLEGTHSECMAAFERCDVVVRNSGKVDALLLRASTITIKSRNRSKNHIDSLDVEKEIDLGSGNGTSCCALVPPLASRAIGINNPLQALCKFSEQNRLTRDWYESLMAIQFFFSPIQGGEEIFLFRISVDDAEEYVQRHCSVSAE